MNQFLTIVTITRRILDHGGGKQTSTFGGSWLQKQMSWVRYSNCWCCLDRFPRKVMCDEHYYFPTVGGIYIEYLEIYNYVLVAVDFTQIRKRQKRELSLLFTIIIY